MAQPRALKRSIPDDFPLDSPKLLKTQKTSHIGDTNELKLPEKYEDASTLNGDGVENFIVQALHHMICVDEFLELVRGYLVILKEEVVEILAYTNNFSNLKSKAVNWMRELDWLDQCLRNTIEDLEIEVKILEEMVNEQCDGWETS